MRALLLKDIYTLLGQMKLFILMLVIFACFFSDGAGSFAIFYAMMLPITSLAYDEQSKWTQLAIMLPYSLKQLVLSKYVLGWGFAFIISLMSMLQCIWLPDSWIITATMFCVAMVFLAVILPFVFWLGTEKGRLILLAVLAGIFGAISAGSWISIRYGNQVPFGSDTAFMLVSLTVIILLNLFSVLLAIKLYKRRLQCN